MVDTFFAFGLMAGVVQLVGYWIYVKVAKNVNTGSWLIWTTSALVDVYYFDYVTSRDLVKEILPVVCSIACMVTFVIMLRRQQFGWPDRTDWTFIGLDLLISLAWWLDWTTGLTANMVIQASTVVSAIPMIRGLLSGREVEKVLPWAIWTTAYVLHLVTVLIQLNSWHEALYPAANIIMHGWILYVVVKVKRRVRFH